MEDKYKIDDNDAFNWTLKKKLSEYNQEELAEELFSYKNDLKNDANIRIGGEYGFSITTIGLDTAQEFLDKYGEILDKAGMPRSAKTAEINEEPVTKKSPVANKPLGKVLTDYTQEEFAALMMDNKTDELDSVVKYRNFIFTTKGCNTALDFINKYQEEFRKLRIKPEIKETTPVEEVKEEVVPNDEPVQEAMPVDEIEGPALELAKEELDFALDKQNFIPGLLDMITKKQTSGKDIETKFGDVVINTEECNSNEDIINKYKDVIASIMKEETTDALNTNIGREGKYLFEIARGNLYNDISTSDGIDLAAIREKEEEYRNIVAKKDAIDFANKKQVYTWLNELVPYVNTHALNLNLGINVSLERPDKYIIDLMKDNGYTTEITYDNVADYVSYDITDKLRDLEEYGFFASEYVNLDQEFRKLNSSKSLASARIKALNKEFSLCEYGIDKIDSTISETRTETDKEKVAIDAYRKACVSNTIENVSYATEAINAIDNEDLKVELTQALNKAAAVSENNELLYEVSPEDLDKQQAEREQKLGQLKDKYTENRDNILTSITELRDKYKIDIKGDLDRLEQEVENFNPGSDIIDKLMEEAEEELTSEETIEEQTQEDDNQDNNNNSGGSGGDEVVETVVDEDEDLNFDLPDEDTIDQFTQIKSIKKITKELYDKITSIKYKTVLQEAINRLNESKRAVITGAGLAISVIASSMSITNNADKLIEDVKIESTTTDENKVEQDNMLLDTLENVDTIENENTGKSM